MTEPVRIQRSRQQKQVSPNGLPIVYVGRPSKWGNHFEVTKDRTPYDAVVLYEDYVNNNKALQYVIKIELEGKNLSCWCRVGEPCHADLLLEIANK